MFKGKKVLVLGLARSGNAAVRLLEHCHATITINESKQPQDIPEYDDYVSRGFEMVCGGQPDELFERDFDFVIKNPGINYHAPFILRLKERGIPVYTEVELGYQVAKPQNYIAITGTNGKTTTVSLIHDILQKAGHKVHICGNFGIPYCDVIMDHHLDEEEGHDIVVEMSNFQLIDIDTFTPQIASVLNLTPDHLDYMASLDEYYASKMRIYMNQRPEHIMINNLDDDVLQTYLRDYPVPSTIETFSVTKEADCMLKDNTIYYKGEKVINRKDIRIVGLHNVSNIMAAIIACAHCGIDCATLGQLIATFRGVEHRIEFVRELDGVSYYNDSKGTNVDATVIALKAFEEPVILLIGGFEKGLDLKPMAELKDNIKALITYGATRERFAKDMGVDPTYIELNLEAACNRAKAIATVGDVVLLSPSTSSFDEFKSYEHRGRVFKDIVNHFEQ
ncbi:MAG: UDP-N-acetylmuramoyl-L-alanine--D-glutamate ligase [Erysipelotrichaceae bacterium]|nr:UDP-N-acetylmuramoyl-L-alanine--D-glutamate ligase [Erysipelotrichaceae bacterium]